ncbi:MAG: FliI/YscN family ATPase [Chitinivibrionales bacterium]
MELSSSYLPVLSAVKEADPVRVYGKVTKVVGLLIESTGPASSVGDACKLEKNGVHVASAEVVGFSGDKTLLMPLGQVEGIHPGLSVVSTGKPLRVAVGDDMLGRVLDGLGKPIDSSKGIHHEEKRSTFSDVPNPLKRGRIKKQLITGISAIDSLLAVGKGQRMGIFSGSGVGKSVLLGMIARNCEADVNVIALIGERGREVREFIERDLGEEGLKRSVVVVATSDQPALIRIKGSMIAATIAEYFRDQGKDVLFMCDSITRLSTAQREVGVATGEPPATRGYTPSVFSMLPSYLERAGTSETGSITGFFNVLVEGGDMDEPIADAARSILDGHIVLSRKLAGRGHYPAIEITSSISRCMNDVVSPGHRDLAVSIKELISAYEENEDLIQIGAYAAGSNPRVDQAVAAKSKLDSFLKQNQKEKRDLSQSLDYLNKLYQETQS